MTSMMTKARKSLMVVSVFGFAAVGAWSAVAPNEASALCMAYRPMSPAYYQAQQAMREGKHSEAMTLFRQAATYPGQAQAWISGAFTNLGARADAAGSGQQARAHYRSALREQPNNTYPANRIVTSYLKEKRPHDALIFLNSLPSSMSKQAPLRSLRASVLEALGDHAGAQALRVPSKQS